MEYRYNPHLNIVEVFPKGAISIEGITQYYSSICDDDLVSGPFVEVVHSDEVSEFQFSSRSFPFVATEFRRVLDAKGVEAIVCIGKSPLQYGTGRMMQTIFELEFPDLWTRVVRSEKEAHDVIRIIRG